MSNSVLVKTVGSEKITVKPTRVNKIWAVPFAYIIFAITLVVSINLFGNNPIGLLFLIACASSFVFLMMSINDEFGLSRNMFMPNFMTDAGFYVDTSVYGIGGKKIRRTYNKDLDHMTICKVAEVLEQQILAKKSETDSIKEIVGNCK